MSKTKTAIIYHDHCLDGYGSAFAAWFFLRNTHELSFHKASYQEAFPNLPEGTEEVYILDFSFSREIILEQRTKYKKVFIIDHHESARDKLEGLEDCLFDMGHSGAYLSWTYFLEKSEINKDALIMQGHALVPTVIHYIQDRDLWTWKLKDTEVFIAGLYMYPRTFEDWARLVSYSEGGADLYGTGSKYKEIFAMGETILKYQQDTISKNINNLINMEFESKNKVYKAKAINSYFLPSETAHAILDKHPEVDIAVCYYEMTPGVFKYSLRSRKDSDVRVNDICGWLGGGGHPSAAGFVTSKWKVASNCVVVVDESKIRFIHRPSDNVGLK